MNKQYYQLKDLFWECTLRCNAYCSFCGSRCGDIFTKELSQKEILGVFEDVAKNFSPQNIMINVTGGEPLLRKDLFEVMSVCSAMGFSWGMVTNGILITPQIIKKMQNSGMKTISISLDGLKETHEQLRGVKNCFYTILNNIKMLHDADFLHHLQVTTVVSRKNINELELLYELLKPLGLDSWRVAIIDPIGRAADNKDLLLKKEDIEYYLQFIRSHRNNDFFSILTSCSHYFGEQDYELGRSPFVCRTGKSVASILANGDIFVCPNVPRHPELIQGNILSDSFSDIWKNKFKPFRKLDARKGSNCEHCADYIRCQGDSAHTWDYVNDEPLFCLRNFFQDPKTKYTQTKDSIINKIKLNTNKLKGIHISYGWKHKYTIIFTPNAAQELFNFFHWGDRHPQNLSELMGALIGHQLSDAILVEFVSPIFLEKRNTNEAKFSQKSFEAAVVETNAINLNYSNCTDLCLLDSPCVLLGFVHSHPDNLDLFLSEADVMLHQKLSEKQIDVSMILNPQKCQIAAYEGKNMDLLEVCILTESDNVNKWKFVAHKYDTEK